MADSPLNRCQHCGKGVVRVRRNMFQRLAYRRVYVCPCGKTRQADPRPLYSTVARCPECGGTTLRVRQSRDNIDRMLKNPFRMSLLLLGGRLYHCEFCRLQFHDVRPRAAGPPEPVRASDVRDNTTPRTARSS